MNQVFPAYKSAAVDSLVPYARNSRTHSAAQISKIAQSIKEFGFLNPVIVDGKNGIVAGHGRVLAAKQLGMTEVPVIEAGHLTEAQRRAYVIADNRLALDAGWDDAILKLEIGELQGLGFDLALTGFEIGELTRITAGGLVGADPDAEVEPEAVAVSRLGDIWTLGDHRIACGDSTDAATVQALLGDDKPHLMVTDPPYGVEYDANWRNNAKRSDGTRVGAFSTGVVKNDDRADWSAAYALFLGDVAYVWHAGRRAAEVHDSLISTGLVVRNQIVWAKSQLSIGRGDYHMQHEPCWYAVRKGKKGHWAGDRKQTTLWQIDKPRKSETGHSTQKPVECMKRPMENNSKPGDYVYEPFSGSGTTIIAAEMIGRKCLAIELHPQYVDLAVRRWQTFTGKVAMLGDKTFAQIEAERA